MCKKVWGNPSGAFIVCIDGYDNGILCGRLYPSFGNEELSFSSTMDFLKCMDSRLNNAQFPQSFCSSRVFQPAQGVAAQSQPTSFHRNGRIATFSLKILFRQNASWQGSLCWLESNQEVAFRSVLELLMLLDNALSA